VPAKKDLRSIRASDSPKQWALWFLLFYPFAAPIYAITRRNWSVLANTLAYCFAISVMWEIAKFAIKSLWSYDIDDNAGLDSFFTLTVLIGISVVAFYSVRHVAAKARRLDFDSQDLERDSFDEVIASKRPQKMRQRRRSVQELLPKLTPLNGRAKILAYVVIGIFVVSVGSYAIYTTTVEATIKSNPVLAAAAKTGTVVRIKHFNCGETYGFYDSGIDTLEICTAVHDDQLFSSKEATIRHEAWHLVQACSSVKTKDDPWGNLVLAKSPLIDDKELTSEEKKYIVDNYGSESHAIESEALLAELNLTDGQIIQAIEEKCYFPE
jgi:hypothetical protein